MKFRSEKKESFKVVISKLLNNLHLCLENVAEKMITAEAVSSGQFQTITIIAETHERIGLENQQSIDQSEVESVPTFLDLFQNK